MAFGRHAFFGWFVPGVRETWWFISMPSGKPLSRDQTATMTTTEEGPGRD